MKLTKYLLFFAFLLLVHSIKAEIEVIPQPQVENYILSLFTTETVRTAAQTPGNRIYDLVKNLSKAPLFVDYPTKNDLLHRENFTAYFGVLNFRNYRNPNPVINDLYFLHELFHISQMPYQTGLSIDEWKKKMTVHEVEVSFITEFALHFEIPGLRDLIPFEIYADKYLKDLIVQEKYKTEPAEVYRQISKDKDQIQEQASPLGLKDSEFRSWYYGRTMEVWAHIYSQIRDQVEPHMIRYKKLLSENPQRAIAYHLKWLQEQSSNGVLFKDLILEYSKVSRTMLPNNLELRNPFLYEAFCDLCSKYSDQLEDLIAKGQVQNTPLLPIARRLLAQGIAATVYSYIFPESERIFYDVVENFNYRENYGNAFIRKQDAAHIEFIESFKNWSSPVLSGLEGYNFAYPSNGSSEALKDTFSYLKGQKPDRTLHIFFGEYEGAPAYAEGIQLPVKKHYRTKESIDQLVSSTKRGDIFYVSQPSGIDGNVWQDYDYFLQSAEKAGLVVIVDLAYLGLVSKPYKINVNSPAIFAVLFSLSKSFGVYYQRIGGAFFRSQNPLLFGNMWFKNLLSLKVGTQLMKRVGIYDLPRRYLWAQTASIQNFNSRSNLKFEPSDVILLGTQRTTKKDADSLDNTDYRSLYRGDPESGFLRINLTPSISAFVEIEQKSSCQNYFN